MDEDLSDGSEEANAGLPGPVCSGVRLSSHAKVLVFGLPVAASVGARPRRAWRWVCDAEAGCGAGGAKGR